METQMDIFDPAPFETDRYRLKMLAAGRSRQLERGGYKMSFHEIRTAERFAIVFRTDAAGISEVLNMASRMVHPNPPERIYWSDGVGGMQEMTLMQFNSVFATLVDFQQAVAKTYHSICMQVDGGQIETQAQYDKVPWPKPYN